MAHQALRPLFFYHNKGTYEALFLFMKPGIYQLSISLDYSLCDGFEDPPRDWFIKRDAQGNIRRKVLLALWMITWKSPFKAEDFLR